MLEGRCKEGGCSAGQGGDCIENLPLDQCPHFVVGVPTEEIAGAETAAPAVELATDALPVRGGKSFNPSEVDAFLRQRPGWVRTVAIIGDPEAGKTTLIASTYELVRTGRMSSIGFAGSDTLRGLEQRCHLSRTRSGRRTSATQRTHHLERLSFLHLDLVAPDRERCDLILCDRAGEDYEAIQKRPTDVGSLSELERFDILCVLLDGERLQDPALRQGHIAKLRRICMAMDAAGLLRRGRRLQLVLTKQDRLKDATSSEAIELFDRFAKEIQAKFPLVRFEEFKTAAMPPKSGDVPFGLNLEALLVSWLEAEPAQSFVSPLDHAPTNSVFDGMTVRFAEGGGK